jgi:hypothetical protein
MIANIKERTVAMIEKIAIIISKPSTLITPFLGN